MKDDLKGIEIVWLSKTGLSNLNSGEGESNLVDIKRFKYRGEEYPYVSGQAMRNYLRQAIRSNMDSNDFMCIPNDSGEGCGKIKTCLNCDLFGYMRTLKGKGAITRLSPVKVAPAIGLLSFRDNSTLDFLTRTKVKGKKTGERSGDIVNVELGVNLYKCGISIDLHRIGAEEIVNEKQKRTEIQRIIPETKRIKRLLQVMNAIRFLTGYSKQARLLTDFTPDLLVISLQKRYSHRMQKLLSLVEGVKLDLERLAAILDDTEDFTAKIFVGMLPGSIANEDAIKEFLSKQKIPVTTPREAIEAAIQAIQT
jgi:CRISPR-associated protein Cst2